MVDFHAALVTPFFAFLAVMSPLANAPIFLGLTTQLSPSQRKTVAVRGTLVAFITVAAFAVVGAAILRSFGITIPAVRAFGGLVVVRIGFELITTSAASSHEPVGASANAGLGIAVAPLAIPIMAGPGTLATALGLTAGQAWDHKAAIVAAFGVVALLNLIAFVAADRLVKKLGEEFIAATTKIMGLILGAIGVQMAVSGFIALAT